MTSVLWFAVALATLFPVGGQAQPRQGPGFGPPPEALAACRGRGDGASCTFRAPHGSVSGLCRRVPTGDTACVPGDRGGPGGGFRGPLGGFGADGRSGDRSGGFGPGGYTPRSPPADAVRLTNRLADTGQGTCFDDRRAIDCPRDGAAYFGQDAQYRARSPAFQDRGDGTVFDGNTGLLWQKAHNPRLGHAEATAACRSLRLGGRRDWRLPTITELFSLADFRGSTGRRFFIDASVFDITYPDESILSGDRFRSTHRVEMMGQTWSSTLYAGRHWDRPGVEAAFFFNFFDGRIKQAPTHGRGPALFYRCVSGPTGGTGSVAGSNAYRDNRDGTVADLSTGLVWQKADDGVGRIWGEALAYCEGLSLAGRSDWRLPNIRELQSLVDYRRSDPALDVSMFRQRDPGGWFWSSTTHGDDPRFAAYICFGKCTSVDGVDVHGAGAQRSDPKSGDPSDYRRGMGGQRDEVRIRNYARCVRDAG